MNIAIGNWEICQDGALGFEVREFGESTKGKNKGQRVQKGVTHYYRRLAQALERVIENAAFDESATVAELLVKLGEIERNVCQILEGRS